MGFSSWFKSLFFEDDKVNLEEVKEIKVEDKDIKNYDYNLKIFDIMKKEQINEVTSYIIQDKALALIKMHKFTGDSQDLKDVLNELKQTCDNCDSKVIGLTNNMYLITKNNINIERENNF